MLSLESGMGQIDKRADEVETEMVVVDRMADFLMIGLEKCKGGGIVLRATGEQQKNAERMRPSIDRPGHGCFITFEKLDKRSLGILKGCFSCRCLKPF